MKKGQVTMFIIIGVVLLLVAGTIFFILSLPEENFFDSTSMVASIQSCLDGTVEDVLSIVTLRGGYWDINEEIITMNQLLYPYYIKNSNNQIVNLKGIEREISRGVEETFPVCLNQTDTSIDISFSTIKSEVRLSKDNVDVKIVSKIKLSQLENTKYLDVLESQVSTDLLKFHSSADKITSLQMENVEEHCETCIIKLVEEGISLDYDEVFKEGTATYYYRLYNDEESFYFAHNLISNDFNLLDLTVSDFSVKVGEQIDFIINSSQQGTFSEDNEFLNIDSNGKVTGSVSEKGEYLVVFRIETEGGDFAEEVITMSVT